MSYFPVAGDITLTHEDTHNEQEVTGPETTSMAAPSAPFRAPSLGMTTTTKILLGVGLLGVLYLLLRKS